MNNPDKINATLSKALTAIQDGEIEELRQHVLEGDEPAEPTTLEEAILVVAGAVQESAKVELDVAIDAAAEVIGEAAAKNLASKADLTEDDIVTWLSQQNGLVESVTEHIKAAA